jgi:hypothetical protein
VYISELRVQNPAKAMIFKGDKNQQYPHRVLKRFIETKVPTDTPDTVMAQMGTGKKKKKCTFLDIISFEFKCFS